MANTASAIVDRVLPDDVPVRQYVLTLPYELRKLAAFKADVLTAIGRVAVEAIFASYRARAKRHGVADGQCGSINFVQRCGSSVNLNIHFHIALLDGVFARDADAGVLFHPASAPARWELDAIIERVEKRAMVWLRRRGHLDERPIDERSSEPLAQTALDACAAMAMGRGQVATLPNGQAPEAEADHDAAPDKPALAVDRGGFNLHAGTRIEAGDDMGRERLMRYGARPPLSLERLRRLPGGRVGYRLKYVSRGRGKFRVMTGLEFMARLASIIAPPRYPLVRYAGVLGPRSAWRKDVVPKPRGLRPSCGATAGDAPVDDTNRPRPAPKKGEGSAAPRHERSMETPSPPEPDRWWRRNDVSRARQHRSPWRRHRARPEYHLGSSLGSTPRWCALRGDPEGGLGFAPAPGGDCDPSRLEGNIRGVVGSPVVTNLDYNSPEGKQLFGTLGPAMLPVAVFDSTLDADKDAVAALSRGLKDARGQRFLSSGNWNPSCADDGGCKLDACKSTMQCRPEVPKKLDVFVMAQCLYGVKGLDAMKEVTDNFKKAGDPIDFQVHYIGDGDTSSLTSMHGPGEVAEDLREACAIKHYGKGLKYMDYVWCRNKSIRDPNWQSCTGGSTGIDTDVIKKCSEGSDEGKQLVAASFAESKALGIGASPTWLANNKYKFSGIDAKTIQSNLCSHNAKLAGCDATLSAAAPPKPGVKEPGCGN